MGENNRNYADRLRNKQYELAFHARRVQGWGVRAVNMSALAAWLYFVPGSIPLTVAYRKLKGESAIPSELIPQRLLPARFRKESDLKGKLDKA
jgi:hypothetical protein